MTDASAPENGVSPLDRAHALRLAGESEAALRLACSLLAASPQDLGAGYLTARLLQAAKRTDAVKEIAPELMQRYLRRGDLPSAWLCAQLLHEAGGDRPAALLQIANTFGAGSTRVADAPALPPPLPAASARPPLPANPALDTLSGEPLLTAAEVALARLANTPDLADERPLQRLPLFGALAPAVLAKLLAAFSLRELAAGQPVVRQGEEGREAFLLARGVLDVVRDQAGEASARLAVLHPGALFGEMALVSTAARAASVVSTTPSIVLAIARAQLEPLAQRDPAIGRELGLFCHQRMVANLLRHSRILSVAPLEKRPDLVSRFVTQSFKPGALLVKQGEESGRLFLIASGLVEVRSTDADGDRMVVAQLGPGDVVGEISLVLRRPATADVISVSGTVALELTRAEFEAAIHEYPGLLQELYDTATTREEETRSVVAREALDVSDNVLL